MNTEGSTSKQIIVGAGEHCLVLDEGVGLV